MEEKKIDALRELIEDFLNVQLRDFDQDEVAIALFTYGVALLARTYGVDPRWKEIMRKIVEDYIEFSNDSERSKKE